MALVRELRESDVEDVVDLSRRVLADIWNRLLRDVYPRRAIRRDLERQNPDFYRAYVESNDVCLVAVEEGRIVGVVACRVDSESGVSLIEWICVDPEFRGRGIGSMLLREALQRCRALGCHKVTLVTLPYLKDALRLYFSEGFVVEAVLKKHWWGVDYLVLSKWLE